MKALRFLVFAAAFAAALPLWGQLQVTRCVPVEAKVLIRVDSAAVLDSQIGLALITQQAQRYAAARKFFVDTIGFDFDTVHTVYVISCEKDRGVAVLHGEFPAAEIETRFGNLPNVAAVDEKGVKYCASFKDDKSGKPMLAAVVDDATLALGDRDSVKRLLATWRQEHEAIAFDDPQLRRFRGYDNQLVATLLGPPAEWIDADPATGAYLKGLWLRADAGQDLTATVTADAVDEATAAGLADLVRGALALQDRHPKMAGPDKAALREILRQGQVAVDGTNASVTLRLPGDAVKDAVARKWR